MRASYPEHVLAVGPAGRHAPKRLARIAVLAFAGLITAASCGRSSLRDVVLGTEAAGGGAGHGGSSSTSPTGPTTGGGGTGGMLPCSGPTPAPMTATRAPRKCA